MSKKIRATTRDYDKYPGRGIGVKGAIAIGVAAMTFSILGADALENFGRSRTTVVNSSGDMAVGLAPSPLVFPMARRLVPPREAKNCTKEVFLSASEQTELLTTGSTTELTQAARSFAANDVLARVGIISSTDATPAPGLVEAVATSVVDEAYPAIITGDQLVFLGVSDMVRSPEVRVDLQSNSCVAAKAVLAAWDQPRPV